MRERAVWPSSTTRRAEPRFRLVGSRPRQRKCPLHGGGGRDAAEYVSRNTLPRILIIDISDSDQPMDALLPVLAAAGESTRVIAIGNTNDIALYRALARK